MEKEPIYYMEVIRAKAIISLDLNRYTTTRQTTSLGYRLIRGTTTNQGQKRVIYRLLL